MVIGANREKYSRIRNREGEGVLKKDGLVVITHEMTLMLLFSWISPRFYYTIC